MRLRAFAVVVLAVLDGMAAPARAEAPSAAAVHETAGRERFQAGDYAKALGEFQKSYDADHEPEMLYNIAQSQRLLGWYNAALWSYRIYLADGLKVAYRENAERHVWELARILVAAPEQTGREQPKPLALAKLPAGNVLLLASLRPEAVVREVVRLRAAGRHQEGLDLLLASEAAERVKHDEEQARQAAKEEKTKAEQEKTEQQNAALKRDLRLAEARWQRTRRSLIIGGGVLTMAVGVAAILFGGYFLYAANEIHDVLLATGNLTVQMRTDDLTGGHRIAGGLLVGPGALLAIVGAGLVVWQHRVASPSPAPRVQLLPAVNGVMVQGRF